MYEFLHRLGQIPPPRDVRRMSVIPPKAAVMGKSSFGRFVPEAVIPANSIPNRQHRHRRVQSEQFCSTTAE
jgi:hypothetical protein